MTQLLMTQRCEPAVTTTNDPVTVNCNNERIVVKSFTDDPVDTGVSMCHNDTATLHCE